MPPSDSNGNYTPVPSYAVQNGDTVLPVQYVPVVEDIANGLTNRLMKDGRTVMTGNLQMGGNKVTGVGDAESDGDAVTYRQLKPLLEVPSFETVAEAEAYEFPDTAAPTVVTAFFDGEQTPGSDAKFVDAGEVDPLSPGQIEISADGVPHFYTRSNKVLRPQQFGCRAGGDPADNHAALIEMFALANAEAREIDMGSASDVYEIDDTIEVDWLTKPVIRGSGATIKLNRDGSGAVGYGLIFNVDDLSVDLEGFEVDGNFETPNPFWIDNRGTTLVPHSKARLVGVGGSNGYRQLQADPAGRGLSIRGWFEELYAEDIFCREMLMAAGAGNPSVSGIVGIFVGRRPSGEFPIYKTIINPSIGSVTCEDDNLDDMDGLMIFDPAPTGERNASIGSTSIIGGRYKNCWGRGIKVQATAVDIVAPDFIYETGPTGFNAIAAIDFQYGSGRVKGGQVLITPQGAPNYAVIATGRTEYASMVDVDGVSISQIGASGSAAASMQAIALMTGETGHQHMGLKVSGCSRKGGGTIDYIANFIARTGNLSTAIVTGNVARSLGTAGVRLQGGGSNTVNSVFQGNANLSSSVPVSASSAGTANVIGNAAANVGFS